MIDMKKDNGMLGYAARAFKTRQWAAFTLAFGWGLLNAASVAQADTLTTGGLPITTDPAASLQPGLLLQNGVPVVNIVAPNAAGLSHNRYLDFNVPGQGLVFNNSTTGGTSTLAGAIGANANLGGQSASLILNEVTGFNSSQLKGYAEVFGQSANLIIANPNGIYVNGAGFINTPRVTLTTGAPQISSGSLSGFNISGGTIQLDGTAIDARTVQITDLVARNILLNAALVTSGDARLYAGQGIWQYASGNFTNSNSTSSSSLAIDATHLGAMSAGRIFIVANEKGAGVNLAGDMSATADDIEINADGDITLGKLHAARDVDINSKKTLQINGGVLAGKDLTLDAKDMSINADMASVGRLSVHATGNVSVDAQVASGSQLNLDVAGTLENASLLYAIGDLNIQAAEIKNNDALIVTEAKLSLSSVSGAISNAGVIYSSQGSQITAATDIVNTAGGDISSSKSQSLFAVGDIRNDASSMASSGNMSLIAGGKLFQDGSVSSAGSLSMRSDELEYMGDTQAGSDVVLDVKGPIHLQGGSLSAAGTIDIHSDESITNDIAIAGASDISLSTPGDFINNGQIDALGYIDIFGSRFSDANGITYEYGVENAYNYGRLYGRGVFTYADSDVYNAGLIAADEYVDFSSAFLNNSSGTVISADELYIYTQGSVVNYGGQLLAQGALFLDAKALDNSGGKIASDTDIDLSIGGGNGYSSDNALENAAGSIIAGGNLSFYARPDKHAKIGNSDGLIQAGQDLSIQAYALTNTHGQIESGRDFTLDLSQLDALFGSIIVGRNADMVLEGDFSLVYPATYEFNGDLTLTVDRYVPWLEDLYLDAVGNITINADAVLGVAARSSTGNITINASHVGGTKDDFYSLEGIQNYFGSLSDIPEDQWQYFWSTGQFDAGYRPNDTYHGYISRLQAAQDIVFNVDTLETKVQFSDTGFNFSTFEAGHDFIINATGDVTLSDQKGIMANHDVIIRLGGYLDGISGNDWNCFVCKILAGNDILIYGNESDIWPGVSLTGVVQAGRDIYIGGNFTLAEGYPFSAEELATGFLGAGRDIYIETDASVFDGSIGNYATISAGRDVNFSSHEVSNVFYQDHYGTIYSDGRIYAAENVNIFTDVLNNSGIIQGGTPYVGRLVVSNTMVSAPQINVLGGSTTPQDVDGYDGSVSVGTPGGATAPGANAGGLLGDATQSPDGLSLPGAPKQPGTSNTGSGNGGSGGTGNGNDTPGKVTAAVQLAESQLTDQQRLIASLEPVPTRKGSLSKAAGSALGRVAASAVQVVAAPAGLMASADEAQLISDPSPVAVSDPSGSVTIVARQAFYNTGSVGAETVSLTGEKGLSFGGKVSADTLLIDNGSADMTSLLGAGWSVRKDLIVQTQGSITNTASKIMVSGDVVLDAGKNLVLKGSAIDAGNALALNAGGNIDLLANITSGWSFSQSLEEQFGDSQAKLKAGCDLSVSAGGNVTAKGASLSSGCDTGVSAGGDVSIAAQEFTRSKTTYNDRGWQTLGDTGQLQNSINSSGALAIQAGKDLELNAAQIKTADDAQLLAGGDILLGTALSSHSDSGKAGKRAITVWDNNSVSNVVTNLDVGGDLLVNVGKSDEGLSLAGKTGAVTSLGADITTGGESYLYGSAINLLAVKDATRNYTAKSKKKKFLGITYSSSSSSSTSLQELLQSSDLIAGEDVGLLARDDINLIASNVSGKNVSLAAGMEGSGNINILGDTQASELITTYEKSRLGFSMSGLLAAGGMPYGSVGQQTKAGSQIQTAQDYIGSSINASGNLLLSAPDALTVTGSELTADGHLRAQAKDITVSAGLATDTSLGNAASGFQSLLANQKAAQQQVTTTTHATSSLLSASAVTLSADNDLSVLGSQLVADNDILLKAGNNVTLGTVTESSTTQANAQSFKNGVFGDGLSVTLGQQKQKLQALQQQQVEVGSLVGSSLGAVTVQAGGSYDQRATTVMGASGINVTASDITVEAGEASYQSEQHQKERQAGITGGISIAALDLVNAARADRDRSGDVQDARLNNVLQAKASIEAAQAAYAGYQTGAALANGLNMSQVAAGDVVNQIGIKASVSAGASSSRSDSSSSGTQAIGSSLTSNGAVNMTATGNGQAGSGDLTVTGSSIKGNDVALMAADALVLQSAQNTSSERNSNSSSGGSIGLGVALGSNGFGLSVDIAAQMAKGNGNGDSISYTESVVAASNNLSLSSGGDTTLKGAQTSGEKITAAVGGNLNLESQQDSSHYDSQQTSAGASVSIPVAGTNASVNGSYSNSEINSDYQSVNEQTGLYAGNGGFGINVGGNTDLKGAVIASTASADKNQLSTDTLTYSDIQNNSSWDVSATSLGLGVNAGPSANLLNPTGINPSLPVNMDDGNSQSGTTKSAIGAGTVTVRQDVATGADSTAGLSRDAEHANDGSLQNDFDLQASNELVELSQAQAALATTIAPYVFKEVGDLSQGRWEEGSPEKIALHAFAAALIAAVAGGDIAAGAGVGAANEWLVGQVNDYIKAQEPPLSQEQQAAIALSASALLGVALGGAQGFSLATVATQNNYLTHKQRDDLKKELAECKARQCSDVESETIMAGYRALSKQNDKALQSSCVDLKSAACISGMKEMVSANEGMPPGAETWNSGQSDGYTAAMQTQANQIKAIMLVDEWKNQNCVGLSTVACDDKLKAADQATKDKLRTALDGAQMLPVAGNVLTIQEGLYTLVTGKDFTDQDASRLMAAVTIGTVGLAKDAKTAGKVLNAVEKKAAKEGAANVTNSITEKFSKKIFGKRDGHLPDTPENRKLLQDVANDPKAVLGPDAHGNEWSSKILDDGSQLWTQTRNGNVINGGLNKTPHTYNPTTGLSAQERPNWK
jgi:filamentous hemagglutinin